MIFCGYLYKQGKDELFVLATNVSIQVSSLLHMHAQTILFALNITNIILFSIIIYSASKCVRNGAKIPFTTFLGLMEEEEIYKLSTMTHPHFAPLFRLAKICPHKQKLW